MSNTGNNNNSSSSRNFIGSTRQRDHSDGKPPPPVQQQSQTKIIVNSGSTETTQNEQDSQNNNNAPPSPNTPPTSTTSGSSVRASRIMLDTDPSIIKAKEMAALFKKKEHYFKLTNFNSPTFCKYCKGFIFGLFKQGFECQECGYTSHKKCLDKAQATPCEKDPEEKKVKEGKEGKEGKESKESPRESKDSLKDSQKNQDKDHLSVPPPADARASSKVDPPPSPSRENSSGSIGTPLVASSSRDNLLSSGIITDATLTKKDDVIARMENMFMEAQRLMMKQQFAETETDNFEKERQKLEPDFVQQDSQRKTLEDKLISSVNLYALDFSKRISALHNVNNKAVLMLTQFEEVKKELQPKVDALKELHNKFKTMTDTNDTLLWSTEGQIVALQSLIATLEKKAAVCKEIIDYNTRTISKKLAEQTAYNEILQSFVDKIEAQRASVEKERQEAEQVASHLVSSAEQLEKLNTIMKARGIYDTQANELFPAVSQIVEKIDDTNIEMCENFEFLKDKTFESDIYMVDEADKDKDIPPESSELKYISEMDEKEKENSKKTANASMLVAQSLPKIKAATVDRLIERLTYPKYPDVTFQKSFLLVYRSFMTPTQLLEKLTFRYCATPRYFYYGKGNSIALMKQTIQTPVRLRVMNVVKYLVDNHFEDWGEDEKLVKLLLNFLNIASPVNPAIVDQLQNTIEKKMNKGTQSEAPAPVFGQKAPEPILPPNFSELIYPVVQLIEFDPLEIARQITIIESQLFREIRPKEFLNQSWLKKDKERRSPNLLKMIRLFNKISNWVYSEIVQTEHFMTRVNRIGKFLQIAKECKKLNNFNAVFEIIAGLENSCVHRLRQTWDCVKPDEIAILEDAKKMIDNHYQKLKQEVHNCSPPCIPYVGMYMTDLVFIYEGANDIVDGNLVNFSKFRKVADMVREIQQYQQQSMYCLNPIPSLQNEIINRQEMSEADAYKLSLRCEARS